MAQLFHAPRVSNPITDPFAEADRQAYNAAFEELGLNWQWDQETFSALPRGRDGVRAYLQLEQQHLLRAYDVDFLVDAIEGARARHDVSTGRFHAGRYDLRGSSIGVGL
jgi:hypothetical protein